jgi:hypothetical protein
MTRKMTTNEVPYVSLECSEAGERGIAEQEADHEQSDEVVFKETQKTRICQGQKWEVDKIYAYNKVILSF